MLKIRNLAMALAFIVSAASLAGEPVDINSADAQSLSAAIKGVGMKKAEAIVAYRKQHGPFQSVDELVRVRGVGQKMVDNSRDQLTVKASGNQTR